ncbi:Phosphoglycolate phosphatase, HAD superfamily [Mucilaginibacter gossypiicola]|uniref:phosphoglycolate phosphatase n=1 Tax=Mucilaginibacter gossypiicola TaxID=551995 RepID=A0A1H8T1Q7_9SPHI|nr:HAD hydrolase-like protein [Mucilaginibacter gossypiicola]SEO84852.1 Phosphoglycolate phosphatase, HAD superfamily [Mucilaginibacter gossypiicola]
MDYKDIDKRKTAFIFELDDVLYPAKDYYFQAYYLFANMLEYIELIDAKAATKVLTDTYIAEGKDAAFDRLTAEFPVAGQYRDKFENLLLTAKLPLKLLLYQNILTLMQDIVVDRKKLFIVTNGNVQEQVNKIKQTEWHGLEKYLRCYFTEETVPKPEPDVINLLIQEHGLQRKEIVMIENSETDKLCAETSGIDYITVEDFL